MYKYPYGDSQQLNLDWILAKIKDMEAAEASDLETISKALISLPYNTTTAYRRYDYAFLNGKLYRCLTDTSGVFNPTAWQEALIGDDLAVLTRWINAIDAAAVVDVKFDTTGTNGKIQQKYHDQYHDVVEVDYTPVQNSKRPLSSNAGYELNGAINNVSNLKGISQLSDLTGGESHFVVFTENVNVSGITIPRHSRGVLVSSTGSDATLYAIDTNGNFYVSYRNSGTWTNAKNMIADITALNDAINAITPLDTAPTQNSTKGITSGAVYKKTTEQVIYQDSGSYTNNIGVDLDLTENITGHSLLKVVTFLNSVASSNRIVLLYPIGGGACYLPAPVDANYNYVRCEAHDKIFSIISSSYATLYVRSISLIL